MLYRDLIGHGFRAVDVREAFRSLRDITEHAALDWLCMHVPPEHLPGRFAGAAPITLTHAVRHAAHAHLPGTEHTLPVPGIVTAP